MSIGITWLDVPFQRNHMTFTVK